MASLVSISVLSLLFLSFSPATSHNPQSKYPSPTSATTSAPGIIQQACKATPFPQPCQTFLTQSKQVQPDSSPTKLIQNAIRISSDNLKIAQSMVKSILDSSAGNENLTKAANLCLENLGRSQYRISQAQDAFPQGKINDARAWMGAVLSYQSGCFSNFKFINDTEMGVKTLSFLDTANEFSSNALSMLMSYDNFGDNIDKWTPSKTERDGFWESSKHEDFQIGTSGGFPLNLTPNVTVCKDGSNGCYKTVQEAVNAAPNNLDGGNKFVIGIKEGVYEEIVRIPLEKKNVVFLGDGMGKTVITGKANAGQPGITTFESATVGVLGDGFMASGVTFQNTAGPAKIQAVAFRTDSDKSVMENCEFLGHQDTLYVHSLRQFFKACRIEGNVDFIFGNSAAFFQDCEILIRPRQIVPENETRNAITAQSRGNPLETTGYVFQNCLINGTEDYMKLYHSNPQIQHNFLGRPWREFARTIFINCTMEDLVAPQGWTPMSANSTLNTVYYGEFNNTGPGSNTSERVPWSNQIPIEHVHTFSVNNFIQGNDWIPTSE